MKQVKNLKIKTQEKLEVKNLKTFPSMEWGEDGGLEADLYLDKVYVGTLFQEGNGGCAIFHWSGSTDRYSPIEVKEKVHSFLLRNDKDYGANSKYEWLRNKTPQTIDDDDIETLVNLIYLQYDINNNVSKMLKKGYKTVAKIDQEYQLSYFHSPYVVSKNAVLDFLNTKNIKYKDVEIFHSLQDLVPVL